MSAEELDALSETVLPHCVQADYLNSGVFTRGGLAMCAQDRVVTRGGGPQPSWIMTPTYVFAEFSNGLARQRSCRSLVLGAGYPFNTGERPRLLRVIWVRCSVFMKRVTVAKLQGDHSEALLSRVSRLNDPTVVAEISQRS